VKVFNLQIFTAYIHSNGSYTGVSVFTRAVFARAHSFIPTTDGRDVAASGLYKQVGLTTEYSEQIKSKTEHDLPFYEASYAS